MYFNDIRQLVFAASILCAAGWVFVFAGCDEAEVKKPASGTTTYQTPNNGGDKIFVTAIELDGHKYFAVTTQNGMAAVHSPECVKCKPLAANGKLNPGWVMSWDAASNTKMYRQLTQEEKDRTNAVKVEKE